MFADQPNDALEEAPRTATFTYTVTTFANPFAVCEKCHRPVSGYYNAPGHGMDRRNVPCRHLGVLSACMSWSPVDGCRCDVPCGPEAWCGTHLIACGPDWEDECKPIDTRGRLIGGGEVPS